MLGVQNSISPVSRLQFPHNSSSSDLFQAPPSPKSFQSVSSPQVHHISFPSDLSHLNSLYRIDNRNKTPRRPASLKRLRLRRSKPVLTARPPLRRFGVEMPRANLCAMPVVSLTISFLFTWMCLSITHLIHVSDCVECTPRNACVARMISCPFHIHISSPYLVKAVPLPLIRPHVLNQQSYTRRLTMIFLIQASTLNQKAAFVPWISVGQVQPALLRRPPPIPQPPTTEQQRCLAGT
jgi:hypothetical protein